MDVTPHEGLNLTDYRMLWKELRLWILKYLGLDQKPTTYYLYDLVSNILFNLPVCQLPHSGLL